jgi:hypothetical protein
MKESLSSKGIPYVTQLLKDKQKSLGDFGIEGKGERN